MRSTGIVRETDALGRIVLPMALRRTGGIGPGDPLEIFVEGEAIILRKYARGCVFCGGMDDLKRFEGHPICSSCRQELRRRLRMARRGRPAKPRVTEGRAMPGWRGDAPGGGAA